MIRGWWGFVSNQFHLSQQKLPAFFVYSVWSLLDSCTRVLPGIQGSWIRMICEMNTGPYLCALCFAARSHLSNTLLTKANRMGKVGMFFMEPVTYLSIRRGMFNYCHVGVHSALCEHRQQLNMNERGGKERKSSWTCLDAAAELRFLWVKARKANFPNRLFLF